VCISFEREARSNLNQPTHQPTHIHTIEINQFQSACSANTLVPLIKESCGFVNKGTYFRPTDDTIAVHMWTHTYLGA